MKKTCEYHEKICGKEVVTKFNALNEDKKCFSIVVDTIIIPNGHSVSALSTTQLYDVWFFVISQPIKKVRD